MTAFGVGMVCMKTVGRESGRYCVVVKNISKSFVEITGPRMLTGVKRRKANTNHLKNLGYVLEIEEGADEETVFEAFDKAGLVKKFGLKRPSAAQIKEVKKTEKKPEPKKEKSKPEAEKEKPKKDEKKK